MLKQRIFSIIAGTVLLATLIGLSGIMADELGLSVTSQTFACENPGSSGGGC